MDILIPLEYDMRIGGKGILFLCIFMFCNIRQIKMLTCYIN